MLFQGLRSTIGRDYMIEPDDVRRTKAALVQTGDYDPSRGGGVDGTPDRGLFQAIETFQGREGLKVDGLMRPNGETDRALRQASARAEGAKTVQPDPRRAAEDPGEAAREARLKQLAAANQKKYDARRRQAAQTAQAASADAPEARPVRDPARMSDPAFGAWSTPAAEDAAESISGMPVPAYRDQVVSPAELARWSQVLDEQGAGPNERRALQEFFVAEGGARSHPGSETHAGITKTTLGLIASKNYGEVAGLKPKELQPEQRAELLRRYHSVEGDKKSLSSAGGIPALKTIPSPEAAAALLDSFYAAPDVDTRVDVIQNAINAVKPGAVAVDGLFGPKTLAAFARLAGDPKTRSALLDRLADERIKDVDASTAIRQSEKVGWRKRIDHFRFRK